MGIMLIPGQMVYLMKKYYLNTKTGETGSYNVYGEFSDFSGEVFRVYGDYIVANFDTEELAKQNKRKWAACLNCKTAVYWRDKDNHSLCGRCKQLLSEINI